MSPSIPPAVLERLTSFRSAFRAWRRTRPFWGGVTAILAGIEMYAITAVPFSLMVVQGVAGVSSAVIMVALVLLAVTTWLQPEIRLATGLLIIVLGLGSILLTNLGGFLIGMLLTLHSGASIASWRPRPAPDAPEAPAGPAPDVLPVPEHGWASGLETPSTPGTTPDQPATTELPVQGGTGTAAERPDAPDAGPSATEGGAGRGWFARRSLPLGAPTLPPGIRRLRRVSRLHSAGTALAVAGLLAGTLPSTAAPSATAPRGSLFCTLLPLLCPSSSESPSPSASPSASPSPGTGATPSPTPTATAGTGSSPDTGGSTGTPGDSATPAPSPTNAGTPACDPALIVDQLAAGTKTAARNAADVLKGCIAAKTAGTLKLGASAASADGLPLVSIPVTHLTASSLALSDLTSPGATTINTRNGPVKVLQFNASRVVIKGLSEDAALPAGRMTLTGGGTVTLEGNVQMYVLSLTGKVLGIPFPQSPEFPIPIPIPIPITFTDVDAQIAYLSTDALTVPTTGITVS